MEIAAVMLRLVRRDGGIDLHAADRVQDGGGLGERRGVMMLLLVHGGAFSMVDKFWTFQPLEGQAVKFEEPDRRSALADLTGSEPDAAALLW